MTELILSSDDGYCVNADQVPRRADAARTLIEEQVGTPCDWRGILRIARDLTGPTMLFHHLTGETEDGACGCEDDSWLCTYATGKPVGRYWWFDGCYLSLEEAAYAYGPDEVPA